MKKLKVYALKSPQPEVQIRGDEKSDFESVGRVMNALQRLGMTKVGFITQPQ
jgi:biopolymer transport protein ExbD